MAPFLECDPQAGVTQYIVDITPPAGSPTSVTFPAQSDGSAKFDLAAELAVGKYTFDLKCADAGGFWSAISSPLSATRFNPPANLKLV
jgi:hypothetical protein